MAAALADLAERDGTPTIGPMPDLRHWQRYSQSSFVALRRTAWHLPERVSTVGWLDTFPQMADVRKVIDADPVISARVDTMVGTEFSLHHRRLDWLLVEHLLDPIVGTETATAIITDPNDVADYSKRHSFYAQYTVTGDPARAVLARIAAEYHDLA